MKLTTHFDPVARLRIFGTSVTLSFTPSLRENYRNMETLPKYSAEHTVLKVQNNSITVTGDENSEFNS
jgi:hypothetical protein